MHHVKKSPIVLEFGSTANSFIESCHATFEADFGYISKIMTRAYEYRFDAYTELQELPKNHDNSEASLEISQEAVDFHVVPRGYATRSARRCCRA